MASITARTNKDGSTSYLIRISNGYSSDGKHLFKSKTYRTEPEMSRAQIKKELKRQTVLFEEEVKNGVSWASNVKFEQYSQYWLEINRGGSGHLLHIQTTNYYC